MLSYVWLYSINPFYLGGFNQTVCPTGNVFCVLSGSPMLCIHSNDAMREYSHRMFNRAKSGAASQLHVKTLLHAKPLQ